MVFREAVTGSSHLLYKDKYKARICGCVQMRNEVVGFIFAMCLHVSTDAKRVCEGFFKAGVLAALYN